jgi:hypothetical protein
MTPKPLDLIVRIALVDEDLLELSPTVWRQFKVSAHVTPDILHDKVLAVIMGWTRNYHAYYMRKIGSKTSHIPLGSNAVDLMHVDHHIAGTEVAAPVTATIGSMLEKAGDRLLYCYDLGDSWRHVVTLEELVSGEDANGWVQVLDGAMRCPDEDGDGCHEYQEKILDQYNKAKAKPKDVRKARKFATLCFSKHNAGNVRSPFIPDEFDVASCQAAVQTALRSRCIRMSI